MNNFFDVFRDVLQGIYQYMNDFKFYVGNIEVTLWQIYLYSFLGIVVVLLIRKWLKG